MRIQLWSYNYDPEPTGIAPVSATLARSLSPDHDIEVVAAHPHYPEPVWGVRLRPYREVRDGIRVTRLPIWPGRHSALARVRQELSFVSGLSAAIPFLGRPDVVVAVTPSFPATAPARAFARLRGVPIVLWVQDILPDGATLSGVMREGRLISAARRFELASYESASRIVVLSETFRENLLAKGVPDEKIVVVYNSATRAIREAERDPAGIDPRRVMTMGNIGHTQNLVAVTEAFESNGELERLGARFVIVGDGAVAPQVRAAIRTDRVEMPGILSDEDLGRELGSAAIAIVSQSYSGTDFNVPSKLMNFLGSGVPVVAAVGEDSEAARIVRNSGGGWIVDDVDRCAALIAELLERPDQLASRGAAGLAYARERFTPERFSAQFEAALEAAVSGADR